MDLFDGIKSGKIDLDKADRMRKVAVVINENIKAEVAAQKVSLEVGGTVYKFGEMPITAG